MLKLQNSTASSSKGSRDNSAQTTQCSSAVLRRWVNYMLQKWVTVAVSGDAFSKSESLQFVHWWHVAKCNVCVNQISSFLQLSWTEESGSWQWRAVSICTALVVWGGHWRPLSEPEPGTTHSCTGHSSAQISSLCTVLHSSSCCVLRDRVMTWSVLCARQ